MITLITPGMFLMSASARSSNKRANNPNNPNNPSKTRTISSNNTLIPAVNNPNNPNNPNTNSMSSSSSNANIITTGIGITKIISKNSINNSSSIRGGSRLLKSPIPQKKSEGSESMLSMSLATPRSLDQALERVKKKDNNKERER